MVVAEDDHDRPALPDAELPVSQDVEVSTATFKVRVDVTVAPRPSAALPSKVRAAHTSAVCEALQAAGKAICPPGPWKRTWAWWTGTAVTAAWGAVHHAEAGLVPVEDDAAVRTSLPPLLAWVQEVVPSGDQRARYERELAGFMNASLPLDRTVVAQAYQDAIRANNDKHANLRAFRNLLALVTGGLFVLVVAFGIMHALDVDFVSLCANPAAASKTATAPCLLGSHPHPRDVGEVELIGALGGLLSIAFGLGDSGPPPSRYNPRPQQAMLKPVAGAATALIGVLVIQSGILVAPVTSVSEPLLLAYAAVFGFAQQLLTQFIDRRAGTLLGGDRSKT